MTPKYMATPWITDHVERGTECSRNRSADRALWLCCARFITRPHRSPSGASVAPALRVGEAGRRGLHRRGGPAVSRGPLGHDTTPPRAPDQQEHGARVSEGRHAAYAHGSADQCRGPNSSAVSRRRRRCAKADDAHEHLVVVNPADAGVMSLAVPVVPWAVVSGRAAPRRRPCRPWWPSVACRLSPPRVRTASPRVGCAPGGGPGRLRRGGGTPGHPARSRDAPPRSDPAPPGRRVLPGPA